MSRTVNFTTYGLIPLARKMGLDPGDAAHVATNTSFPTDLARHYGQFLDLSVKKIHDRFDFPDYILVEQRIPDANHYVAFEQSGLTYIDRVLKVFQRDPRLTIPQCDVPFRLDANGVHVGYDHGTNVWLKFMTYAPGFGTLPWEAAPPYDKFNVVYATDGECYESLQNGNTNHNPANGANPTWWKMQPFWDQTADLVVRLAFAEALREDGQFDKANAEESAALQEAVSLVSAHVAQPFDTITDQARHASRYRPVTFNLPFPTGGGK